MNRVRTKLKGITLRPVRADDRDRIVNAFQALDPQTIYQRFFFPKTELSDEELQRLTRCDGVREVVLVATAGRGAREKIVGLGRYSGSGTNAQIAFTVEEDFQGRGIASALLRQLADIARANGFTQLEADMLASNAAMLKVFRRSQLPKRESVEDGVVHMTLSLGG
jgi:GNAT superfamily N-acetyltransferase